MTDTGVPEDEGQHLQSVFTPAVKHGGPGRFAFDPASHMTERSVKRIHEERETLLREWGAYYNFDKRLFIEKSPPNLVRSRYLQALFPDAKFLFVVRHPIAVSLATEKWSRTTRLELMLHWHIAHSVALRDTPHIKNKFVVRYEDLINDTSDTIVKISQFLGISLIQPKHVTYNYNKKYFALWEKNVSIDVAFLDDIINTPCSPMHRFSYTLKPPYLLPIDLVT